MKYENTSGKSLSDISKEIEEKDKKIQIVIVGAGAEDGKLAHVLARMLKDDQFACVDINTLPQADQDQINKKSETSSLESLPLPKPEPIIIKNYRQDLPEVFISDKKKPWEPLPRKRKKKGWQK